MSSSLTFLSSGHTSLVRAGRPADVAAWGRTRCLGERRGDLVSQEGFLPPARTLWRLQACPHRQEPGHGEPPATSSGHQAPAVSSPFPHAALVLRHRTSAVLLEASAQSRQKEGRTKDAPRRAHTHAPLPLGLGGQNCATGSPQPKGVKAKRLVTDPQALDRNGCVWAAVMHSRYRKRLSCLRAISK